MIKRIFSLFYIIACFAQAQTFEWVSTVPHEIQTNPAFLHSPVSYVLILFSIQYLLLADI
jgi:hypothetical protein